MKTLAKPLALAAVAAMLGTACGDDGGSGDDDVVDTDAGIPDASTPPQLRCEAGDQAFVRNAMVAVLGRRPLGQAEVDVYADIIGQVRGDADPEDLDAHNAARKAALYAMMDQPGFVDRWTPYFMDALRVARIEDQNLRSCYGASRRDDDDGALADYVRSNGPMASGDGGGEFTLLDLLRSSLILDDVSPVYRAHIFALVSRPIPAANVPRVEAELARRADFGTVFDSAYLNRDLVCLGCHNSEASVTYRDDPATNRHWAIPGLFEKSVYGNSFGAGPDEAHAVFRYDEFVADGFFGNTGDDIPWGWDDGCGSFNLRGLDPDPAGVQANFAGITGTTSTVYDLEVALRNGFESLAAQGLTLGDGNEIADPNQALAYLVSMTVAEGMWKEVIGTPLTIANYFPRNEASRDMLYALTEAFIDSGFSPRELLAEIVLSEYFNRLSPDAGCGRDAYGMPAIYDPWSADDPDESRRGNSTADGVSALSARVLLRSAYAALEWAPPLFQDFPRPSSCEEFSCGQLENLCNSQGDCCTTYEVVCVSENEPTGSEEQLFQRATGVFHKNAERGFRGLDFQARLVWEDRFGQCRKLRADPDFIDGVVAAAAAGDATVGDVVAVLKDRFIGEAAVDSADEIAALEAIYGASLDSPASSVADLAGATRTVCGVLLSSPQFLLGGFAAPDGEVTPALTPAGAGYDAVCESLSLRDYALTCNGDGTLTVQ